VSEKERDQAKEVMLKDNGVLCEWDGGWEEKSERGYSFWFNFFSLKILYEWHINVFTDCGNFFWMKVVQKYYLI